MIDAINQFFQEAQQRSIKPMEGDIYHFNKKIGDAARTKMFTKLGNGILTLPCLNDQQKTNMQQKMLLLQKWMDQIQERQFQFNIHINKYVQDWGSKTFQIALEVQHAGQLLMQSTFCNHKSQLTTFLEKYEKLLNFSYFWEHLIHLESKYNPVEINLQQLRTIIESYGERRIVQTRIKETQSQILTYDKSVLVQIKIPDLELEQKLYETQQKLYTALEQTNINQDYQQLLEAHELVYGMNCLQDVKKGMELYKQINNKKSLNSLAFLHQQGKVVPLDMNEASSIYQILIKESNDQQAKYQLGRIKFLEKQTQKEGFKLMKEAADQDHIESCIEVGMLYWKGVKQNGQYLVEQNQTLAKQYALKGKNTPKGLCSLGQIELDSKKSVEYYQQSIEKGYLPAYYYLGLHYEMDHRVKEAQHQYTQGAKKQVVQCMEKLLHYQLEEALKLNLLQKYQDYLQCLGTVKQSGEAFYHLAMCNVQDQQVQQIYLQLGAKLNNEKCILKLGELKMDEQTLGKLTAIDDDCALFLLGLHYEQQGLLDEAIEFYKKSNTSEANQHLSQLFKSKNEVLMSQKYQQLSIKTPRMDSESEYIQSLIMTKSRTE